MTEPLDITAWHHCYRESSGEVVTLNFYRESMWREFLRYMAQNRPDFTMADLHSIIALRLRRKKEKVYGHQSIAFNALIGSPDLCEEDISEARGKQRIAKPDNRQRVLAQSGRPTQPEKPARPVEQIIRNDKAFERFREQMKAEGLL